MRHKFWLFAAASAMATSAAFSSAHATTEPFIGEIMTVGENFCPRGWAKAEGQILPINSNQSLFSLYGCTYGGDCRTSFGLPDLRGRAAMSMGTGPGLTPRPLGQKSGSESNVHILSNLPNHNHRIDTTEVAPNTHDPNGSVFATFDINGDDIYTNGNPTIQHQMAPNAMTNNGASQQVNNMQPFQVVLYCVALQGIFPPRN